MTGLRERNRRRTSQEIAEAALRLFDERGFDATTVDDVARVAGVSRSTFFRYFATKEHAVFPDHDRALAAYRARLEATSPASSPWEGILAAARTAAQATIDAFRRDPDLYRTRQRVIASSPSVRQLALRLDRDWEQALAESFERQLGDGRDAGLHGALLAGSLMGTVAAFHRLWASEGFRRDPATYEEAVMTVFERGVAGVVRR